MPTKRDASYYQQLEMMLPQGARSRYMRMLQALDDIEDLMPDDALDGDRSQFNEVAQKVQVVQQNLFELLAYRKMMGID